MASSSALFSKNSRLPNFDHTVLQCRHNRFRYAGFSYAVTPQTLNYRASSANSCASVALGVSVHPSRWRTLRFRSTLVVVHSGVKDPSEGDDRDPSRRRNRGNNNNPFSAWLSGTAVQAVLRLAFNVAAFFFLMRLWPFSDRNNEAENGAAHVVRINVPFSDFIHRLKKDEVQTVTLESDDAKVVFTPKDGSELTTLSKPLVDTMKQKGEQVSFRYYTQKPSDYAMPYSMLESNGVVFSVVPRSENKFATLLVYALYGGLFLAVVSRLPIKLPGASKGPGRRHLQGSGEGGRPGTGEMLQVTFADVAGVDEAKEELKEIVEILRAPEKFKKLGARPPSGVLLVGPPGTGKTLLARAVAGEADVPFFSISASEFVELYVGMGAQRVRELFANARKEAPAIVFIDEIDAVAKGRETRLRSVGNDEREQTLNQLLTELDGFESGKEGAGVVICIAATNRADVLDPALLRPGRFDRRVPVERPDRIGREQILGVHMKKRSLPLSTDVNVTDVAAMTTGFTGADLANLVNEAALLAGRESKDQVGKSEFDAAVLRTVAGIEKKRSILQGIEKQVVARHEVGHAVVASCIQMLLPAHSPSVEKLSIIPRSGGALGFTYMPPKTEDRALMFDSEIRGQLVVLMGGRAAEMLTCEAVSTGASDDIRRATEMAQQAVSEYGLGCSVGPVSVSVLSGASSDNFAAVMSSRGASASRAAELEVRELVKSALLVAKEALYVNMGVHKGLSVLLEEKERIDAEELKLWLKELQVPLALRDFVLLGSIPDKSNISHNT
ncbi:hypothetical protein CEUSTIGMA_g9884.t1 [Chlamydomonas eustigma]|uniref:AAA+ ATPase domain-containing protein n=1 Tax=Chlamydomonas eustigma TaxID=1157962 RepID=A0A250XHA5_9CHLO|nr:hypothetical protein CEUSTIGMA_g9884.t1 [Chlamydomonas eustigma]|eukprot:GAX82457.1 hypothetical protein CEUSTIGMA_g9884.t1 [Chlamydomonas eustigma]